MRTCSNMDAYESVLSRVSSHMQDFAPVERQERPFPQRQLQQASIMQQLVNVYVSFLPPFLLLWSQTGFG